jgi:hypothetical protein
VYGHGRTLKAAARNTTEALALVGVTAEVVLLAVTPELEKLRAAEDAYTTALKQAAAALALRRTSLSDIAQAVRAPRSRVKQLLAEQASEEPQAEDSVPGRIEPVPQSGTDGQVCCPAVGCGPRQPAAPVACCGAWPRPSQPGTAPPAPSRSPSPPRTPHVLHHLVP